MLRPCLAARSRNRRDMACRAPLRSCLRVCPDIFAGCLTAALRSGARQLRCPGGRRPLPYTATHAAPTGPTCAPAEPPRCSSSGATPTLFRGEERHGPLRTLPINPRLKARHESSRLIAAQRFRVHRPPQAVRCDEGLGGHALRVTPRSLADWVPEGGLDRRDGRIVICRHAYGELRRRGPPNRAHVDMTMRSD